MTKKVLKISLCLYAGFFLLYLFTSPEQIPKDDARIMLEVSNRIYHHGFSPHPRRENRLTYSKYGLGQSLIDLAVVWAYKPAARDTDENRFNFYMLIVSALPSFLGASVNVLLFLIALRLGLKIQTGILLALINGLTTTTWVYAKTLFADPTLGLLWLFCIYAFLSYRTTKKKYWLNIAGLSLGFSILTKVISLYTLPVFFAYFLYLEFFDHAPLSGNAQKGKSGNAYISVLWFVTPLIITGCVVLWYNNLRYGEFLNFAYDEGRDKIFGFDNAFLSGLYGQLLSTGKGFFFFSPSALLGIIGLKRFFERFKAEAIVTVSIVAGMILAYSKWWAWHADWSWGPRFLSGLPPFFILMSGVWLEEFVAWEKIRRFSYKLRGVFLAFFLLISLTVQIPGLCILAQNYILYVTEQIDVFHGKFYEPQKWPIHDDLLQIHFIPDFNPIAGQLWMMDAISNRDGSEEELREILESPPWAALNPLWKPKRFDQTLFRYHIWWLYARQVGLPEAGKYTMIALLLLLSAIGFFASGLYMAFKE